MGTTENPDPVLATANEPAWRQRAVARSTQPAKLRAEQRVQRFLDAANAIIAERGATDFTVQQVVERSKQSLRSFYQYFDGKHELLLALLEEAVGATLHELALAARAQDRPLTRLQAAVERLADLTGRGADGRRPPLAEFATQLAVDHPDEVAAAYSPLHELLAGLIEDAARAGVLRPADPRRLTGFVLQVGMCSAQLGFGPAEVWDFCLHGLAARGEVDGDAERRAGQGRPLEPVNV